MARPRARMPEVESLEGKQLLSTMHVTHPAARKPAPLVLDGDLKDPVDNVAYNSDSSHSEEQFSGKVKSMGAVQGTIVNYQPYTPPLNDPKIVLTNSRGSVTLVFGENSRISQSDIVTKVVTRFRFTVQSGTGAYAGASGAGVFTETIDTGNIHSAGWVTPKVDLKLHTTSSR
jgi:hypothetical protein